MSLAFGPKGLSAILTKSLYTLNEGVERFIASGPRANRCLSVLLELDKLLSCEPALE